MPMTDDQLEELKGLLAVAKKRPLSFGLCMGKKPEDTVFVLHRMKEPDILGRQAKKDGDTAKVAFGQIEVKGKKAVLTCHGDIPAGIAKSTKKFLTGIKMPLKITVMDATGALAEDDGDAEEPDDGQDAAVADQPEVTATDAGNDDGGNDSGSNAGNDGGNDATVPPEAAAWAKVEAALTPAVARFVESGAEKSAAVQAAWAGALKAAAGGKYDVAMAVVQKVRPLLEGSSSGNEPTPSPDQQRFAAVLSALQGLFDRAMALEPDDESQLRADWAAMQDLASRGDFAGALKAAGAIKPKLDAAIQAGAAAEAFQITYLRVSDIYTEAMKFNPPNRTQLEGAWGAVSTLGFDRKDYAKAEAAAAKVEAALRQVIAAGQQGAPGDQDIPSDVVPYAKARISWASARSTMRTEVRKLEAAILAVTKDDPDLAGLANNVGSLSQRLDVFTDALEDTLDAVVNTPPGPERERLKQAAIAALTTYRTALQDDFFRDVDASNGFVTVDVAGAADRALRDVEQALAA